MSSPGDRNTETHQKKASLSDRVKQCSWRDVTVEPAIFLYALGKGLGGPTDHAILYRKVCLSLYAPYTCDNLYTNESFAGALDETQKATSRWQFYESVCYTVPSLLMVALFGSWSDRFSRKIPLFLGPAGSMLLTLTYLLNAVFMDGPVGWLLVGSLIYGFSGGMGTFFMAAFSYLSSVSSPSGRSSRIAVVYAFNTLPSALAHAVSGVLLDHTGFFTVYALVLATYTLALVYLVVWLVEVLPATADAQRKEVDNLDKINAILDNINGATSKDKRATGTDTGAEDAHNKDVKDTDIINAEGSTDTSLATDSNANTAKEDSSAKPARGTSAFHGKTCCQSVLLLFNFTHFKESFVVTFRKRGGNDRKHIILIVTALFVIGASSAGSVYYLFYRHPPLSWSQTLYGYYSGYSSLVHVVGYLVYVPLMKRWFGVSDQMLLVSGVVVDVVARSWTGFCVTTWMVFLSPIISFGTVVIMPSIRALVASMVAPDEYGKIFAVVAWLESLSHLLASSLYSAWLYPLTVDVHAGISFFVSGLLTLIPLSLVIYLCISLRHGVSGYDQFDQETNNSRDVNNIIEQIVMIESTTTAELLDVT